MSYLDKLPDEIYRMVLRYMYAAPMEQILTEMPLVTGLWPPPSLVFVLQNGSDHVRSQSLNNTYRRYLRHYREADWFKLLIDMERPSAYKLQGYGFNSWLVRRYKVFDMTAEGGIWWNSCRQPSRLTYAGWGRLLGNPAAHAERDRISDSLFHGDISVLKRI